MKRFLAIYRPRSKHTSLFFPLSQWVIPKDEIVNTYFLKGGEKSRLSFTNHSSILLPSFKPSHLNGYSDIIAILAVSGEKNVDALISGCKRCVLLFGLYELLQESDISLENLNKIYNSTAISFSRSKSIAFSVLGEECLQDFFVSYAKKAFQVSDGDMTLSILKPTDYTNDDKVTHIRIFSSFQNKLCMHSSNELLSAAAQYHIMCKKVVHGMASPRLCGEGYREVLPVPTSLRRPLTGVLQSYALNGMPFKSKTSMEPELSLLMANLANIQSGSRVMDPFCGVCSILSVALYYGANHLVGVDSNKDVLNKTGITQNLDYFHKVFNDDSQHQRNKSLTIQICHGSITSISSQQMMKDNLLDAIITDPPYGMKELWSDTIPTFEEIMEDHPRSVEFNRPIHCHESSNLTYTSSEWLLKVAHDTLRPGGRVVFFHPVVVADEFKAVYYTIDGLVLTDDDPYPSKSGKDESDDIKNKRLFSKRTRKLRLKRSSVDVETYKTG